MSRPTRAEAILWLVLQNKATENLMPMVDIAKAFGPELERSFNLTSLRLTEIFQEATDITKEVLKDE